MRLTTILMIAIIVGVLLFYKAPDMYSKTYGFAWDKSKEAYHTYIDKKVGTEGVEPLHQDVIEGNKVVAPICGKNYGQPYDIFKENGEDVIYHFLCTDDGQCLRFSASAKCDKSNGECQEVC